MTYDMYARGPDGGDGGGGQRTEFLRAVQEHLDRVELGRIEQYTETLTITPAFAAMILAQYAPEDSNRRRRLAYARALAHEMREGRWHGRTHQGIAFRSDGVLADGQHRLTACVLSGVAITLPVTYGQPDDVFRVTDQHKPRGAEDLLTVGKVDVANKAGAAACGRLLLLLRNAGPVRGGEMRRNAYAVTRQTVLQFVSAHPAEINEAVRIGERTAGGLKVGVSQAQLGAAAYLIREVCKDDQAVLQFFDLLRDGANLAAGSPVLVLRDALKDKTVLTNNPQGSVRAGQFVGGVINGWNLWRQRFTRVGIKRIVWSPATDFPQARP